jgi:hypothetical protein
MQVQQNQETRNVPVTAYQLTAPGGRIAFRAENQDTMTLEYNGQQFCGEALQREQTTLGLVVSAVVEAIPDLHTVTLSVTVPEGNRLSSERTIPIRTFAVLTTARTSIAGPALVNGQIQSYQLVPLEGTAR